MPAQRWHAQVKARKPSQMSILRIISRLLPGRGPKFRQRGTHQSVPTRLPPEEADRQIRPEERRVFGEDEWDGHRVNGSKETVRIEWLMKHHLVHVADGNWTTLHRDPLDGRFWERTYPHGERHGGGPPMLQMISAEEARQWYVLSSETSDP